jgi:hypothetical protein
MEFSGERCFLCIDPLIMSDDKKLSMGELTNKKKGRRKSRGQRKHDQQASPLSTAPPPQSSRITLVINILSIPLFVAFLFCYMND